MRILLTCQPIFSHLVPVLVPLARAAAALGHEVAVATAPDMAGELARHGVAHLPLPNVFSLARLRTDPDLAVRFGLPQELMAPGRRVVDPSVMRRIARAYAGPIALPFAQDLLEAAGAWRPDVIVREPAEHGGYLAAEALDIPHAALDISPFAMIDSPAVLDTLNDQRVALGLKPVDDPLHPLRHLRAEVVPRSWYPPELRVPTGRGYRLPAAQLSAPLDPALAGLPSDRPLVLASLGSMALSLPSLADLLPMIARALGRVDCNAVLALGAPGDVARHVGAPPSNVHVTPFVPQAPLLGACDLLVTHGGFGSIREALAAGVPMVVLPSVADQPANARRIADLGLGLALDADTVTVDGIADACARVLGDPSYRWKARAMQREMLAGPGLDQLTADLVALADRSR